ncbi:S1 family peptidase [Salipiger mucosus]|uniref:Serine protease n=1 Tax=Salipiger mucosus DSM 16094 TaxID=1123237 RepID=S9QUU9_9RHOB|nr:serine protease [Salipiger mucosus]EPX85131.1 hypothetical protein Salmuc_01087 [Salipiger mucosus DSM 16094]
MTEYEDRKGEGFGPMLDDELQAASEAVRRFGPASIDVLLDRIAEAEEEGARASPDAVASLMKTCRSRRGFAQMRELAEIFAALDDPRIWLFQCQARIDMGDLRLAVHRLHRLLHLVGRDRKLTSEVLGLLGRAQKQEFVLRSAAGDAEAAEVALRAAMHHYAEGYAHDPAWHGANLAALAWRAEREGFALDDSAAAIGARLVADMEALADPSAWDVAARAQGHMAQGDWRQGRLDYTDYFYRLEEAEGQPAAFHIYGDLRQLSEIWLGDGPGGEGPAKILDTLRKAMATTALPGCDDSDVSDFLSAMQTPGVDQAEAFEELQAIVARGELIPVQEMCAIVENRDAVARIADVSGAPRGTGFLLDGAPFGTPGGQPVFVTNNHVLASEPTMSAQRAPEDLRVHFLSWDAAPNAGFTIDRVLAESPVRHADGTPGHDITIALLKDLPPSAHAARLKVPAEHFLRPTAGGGPLGRVHPVGHPMGGELSLSLAGNELVDHELYKGDRGVRRLHYKANTQEGSSGSPVFGTGGHVVGVHRAATRHPITGSPLPPDPHYHVNEGIGIRCIIAWFQSRPAA